MPERSFLGTGWAFPIAVSPTGGIRTASEEEKVRQSIGIILGTRPGERDMRPDFGCDLHQFVFEPQNDDLRGRAAFHARRALERWEPRIDLREVEVRRTATRLEIAARYVVRATNREDNIVVPFYAGEEF